MPILFRAEDWLTFAQLVPSWAKELATIDGANETEEIERLWRCLGQDVIEGRLNLLGYIEPSGQTKPVRGELLIGKMGLPLRAIANRLLVSKKALLDLCDRRTLPPPSWWVEKKQPGRGPKPGTVDRFGESDRALFPEIKRRMRKGAKSVHAVATELAAEKRIKGSGTEASLAKRLARLYRKEHPGSH